MGLSKSATKKNVSDEPPVDEAESLIRPGIVPNKKYSKAYRKIKKIYRRRDSYLRIHSRKVKQKLSSRHSIDPLVPTKEHLKQLQTAANKVEKAAKKREKEAKKASEDKTPKNKTKNKNKNKTKH